MLHTYGPILIILVIPLQETIQQDPGRCAIVILRSQFQKLTKMMFDDCRRRLNTSYQNWNKIRTTATTNMMMMMMMMMTVTSRIRVIPVTTCRILLLLSMLFSSSVSVENSQLFHGSCRLWEEGQRRPIFF